MGLSKVVQAPRAAPVIKQPIGANRRLIDRDVFRPDRLTGLSPAGLSSRGFYAKADRTELRRRTTAERAEDRGTNIPPERASISHVEAKMQHSRSGMRRLRSSYPGLPSRLGIAGCSPTAPRGCLRSIDPAFPRYWRPARRLAQKKPAKGIWEVMPGWNESGPALCARDRAGRHHRKRKRFP